MTAEELRSAMQNLGFAVSLDMAENAIALASDPSLARLSFYYARIRRGCLFHQGDVYMATCEMLAVALVANSEE